MLIIKINYKGEYNAPLWLSSSVNILATVTLTLAPLVVAAAGSNFCSQIQDHDKRAECLAISRNQNSYCTQIQAQDERARCQAQVTIDRNQKDEQRQDGAHKGRPYSPTSPAR